jgi:Mn2+/Fe2+ NRAMP family transporter
MITSWDIYWITRLDNIVACAISFSIVGGFAAIIAAIFIPILADCIGISGKAWKIIKKVVKIFIPIYIVAFIIAISCPSSKEFVAIMFIPKIANNEQVQQVPENVLKLISSKLHEWLADIEGFKKK